MAKSSAVAPTELNVIAATKTFKLLSGVECEIRKMRTKHQGILTENGGDVLEAFDTILVDCIVRIGTNRSINKAFIRTMLSKDKKLALIKLREFSFPQSYEEVEDENTGDVGKEYFNGFWFDYEYLNRAKRKVIERVKIDIDACTVTSPYKAMHDGVLTDADYEEYDLIQREFTKVLPNGLKVAVALQDGQSEASVARLKRSTINVNTQFLLSRCRKMVSMGDTGKEMPIELNVRDIDDLESSEALRQFIRSIEATCETEVDFEHPETGQIVTVDFMGSVNFLFPSGVK